MASKIRQLLQNAAPANNKENIYEFDDDKAEVKQTKTTKLTNENSSIKKPIKTPNIKENIDKLVGNEMEQLKTVQILTGKLIYLINDKTLDINKDPTMRNEEKRILSEYAELAQLLNEDPNRQDCYGTLTFLMAISRCLLVQRDRVNELEYELVKVRKQSQEILLKLKEKTT